VASDLDIFNRVCASIPEGWQILISLEHSYGGIVIVDPDGDVSDWYEDDITFEEMVHNAMQYCIDNDGDFNE